jgi:hypothetical protein
MVLTFEQVQAIVLNNPNKELIDYGIEQNTKLSMHVDGVGLKEAIQHVDYFASKELFQIQQKYALSNKDVFGRLLEMENMIFTARGGSSYYSLANDSQEAEMNRLMQSVRFGISLRKWMQDFAIKAYRTDPMGVILIEIEKMQVDATGQMKEPSAYPTYQSIHGIYDYLPNGRGLEYIAFRLTKKQAVAFGINDRDLDSLSADKLTEYFRVIDDAKDLIVKRKDSQVNLVENIEQQNPIENPWKKTPAFIISNLMRYNEPKKFASPLDLVVELADCFLNDRSIRDLQKKYHGFAKAVEPLLQCPTCEGTGYVSSKACPSCTAPGQDKGSGYKLKTKVSDVAKFPLEILESASFDFRKIFGYVTPDIESWNKQDSSLEDLEELIEMTYWGTIRTKRRKNNQQQGDEERTATEVDSNEQPKESRLNHTADWAESTENMIADFIGKYWFEDSFTKASINYGRDYVLRTPDELLAAYLTLRTKGAPDFTLDESLEKYYKAKYQNSPVQLQKYLKMLDVEPFPHIGIVQAKSVIADFTEFNSKLYFGEWANTVPDIDWLRKKPTVLKAELKAYVEAKGLKEPAPVDPVLN